MSTQRTIVIGDVHGCLTELDELLRQVEHRPGVDRLIFCGDLVDRGPEPLGVVLRVMELGAECVMGNHEDAHLRFRQHQRRVLTEGLQPEDNPMWRRLHIGDFRHVQEQLGEREWGWLASLPNFIHLDERWTVVHAGCRAGVAVEDQDPGDLQRMRYVLRETGERVPLGKEMRPSTHAFWTELWTGPRSIVYGHHVEKRGPVWSHFGEPRIDFSLNETDGRVYEPSAVGIDTGCAYGGSLSAVIIERLQNGHWRYQTESVPATGKWSEWRDEKWVEE